MTNSRLSASGAVAALVLCGGLAAGCAEPGQLGSTTPAAQDVNAQRAEPQPAPSNQGPSNPAPLNQDGLNQAPMNQDGPGVNQQGSPPPAGAPAAPEVLGEGRLDSRVTIRTQGEATYSVRTVVLAPGTATAWQRNPGSEIAAVRSGAVVVQRAEKRDGERDEERDDERANRCSDASFTQGAAFTVPDGEPYRIRNDGQAPAELLVTRLFAPKFPEPEPVAPPC